MKLDLEGVKTVLERTVGAMVTLKRDKNVFKYPLVKEKDDIWSCGGYSPFKAEDVSCIRKKGSTGEVQIFVTGEPRLTLAFCVGSECSVEWGGKAVERGLLFEKDGAWGLARKQEVKLWFKREGVTGLEVVEGVVRITLADGGTKVREADATNSEMLHPLAAGQCVLNPSPDTSCAWLEQHRDKTVLLREGADSFRQGVLSKHGDGWRHHPADGLGLYFTVDAIWGLGPSRITLTCERQLGALNSKDVVATGLNGVEVTGTLCRAPLGGFALVKSGGTLLRFQLKDVTWVGKGRLALNLRVEKPAAAIRSESVADAMVGRDVVVRVPGTLYKTPAGYLVCGWAGNFGPFRELEVLSVGPGAPEFRGKKQ